jgi:hypothetical protein
MKIETASLIIRLELSLAENGANFRGPEEPADTDVIAKAVQVAGHLFHPHDLALYGLVTSDELIHRLAGGTP